MRQNASYCGECTQLPYRERGPGFRRAELATNAVHQMIYFALSRHLLVR